MSRFTSLVADERQERSSEREVQCTRGRMGGWGRRNALLSSSREKRTGTSVPRRVTLEIVKRAVDPSILPSPLVPPLLIFYPSPSSPPFFRTPVFPPLRRFRLSPDARCTRSLVLFTINYGTVDSQTPS